MRPRGSFGPVGMALLDAASAAPGKVRDLAARAQVSYAAARYTASRLVDAGALVMIDSGRPATLAAAPAPTGQDLAALMVLHRLPAAHPAAAEACVA